MEQIRNILKQLTLHLELNIAMCDKIDDLEKTVKRLEQSQDGLSKKLNAANTLISNLTYKLSSDAYEARKSASRGE